MHNDMSSLQITCSCSSSAHRLQSQNQQLRLSMAGLPAGVKFDPTDEEIIQHLEAKVKCDKEKMHPLIDQFIHTLEGDHGICYTHPQTLPGVKKDGQIRHFFHKPPKAYTSGTRKRRKVHRDEDENESRWHKTGKTRPILSGEFVKGFKKILVLYTDYGRQRKPQKTNWVMHQYHIGISEQEKDGELVVSKIFFQKQPRHCSSTQNISEDSDHKTLKNGSQIEAISDYSNPTSLSFSHSGESSSHCLISNLQCLEGDGLYLSG